MSESPWTTETFTVVDDRNPEQSVLDEIDALVDEQLDAGERRGPVDRCRCGREWHGLPRGGCPGASTEGPPIDDRSDPRAQAAAEGDPVFRAYAMLQATWDLLCDMLCVPRTVFDIDLSDVLLAARDGSDA